MKEGDGQSIAVGGGSGSVCGYDWGERGEIGNFLLWAEDLVQRVGIIGMKRGDRQFFAMGGGSGPVRRYNWGEREVICNCLLWA